MYYVNIQHFYYQGTFNTPKDGPMTDRWGDKKIFKSVQHAKEYLWSIGITETITKQSLTSDGMYYLEHGEYERPQYKIRKIRTK